ncbi:MAG: YpdA family putative bacillithiol disulfide reductase [Bacteroidota bacterium]
MENFDLIIIGGGPSGINCAISAEKANLKYLVLEKGVLANSIYNFPSNMTFFSTSKLLEIGSIPFISHGEKPTRKEALEYYLRLIQHFDLSINFYEEVLALNPTTDGQYDVLSNKANYKANSVIIATGFYDCPRMLDVPGETLPKVTHYYSNPYPYVGQKVLVVGARNSACDAALETYYKGAQVTMAIRGDEIYPKVKYWIRPNIINRIKEGSIKAHFNTRVLEIREKEVVLENVEGRFVIENDFVLAMTGYQPNYQLFEKFGIACSEDANRIPLQDENTLETNLPNVYMAGVACSGRQTSKLFIENTRDHGDVIVNAIKKRAIRANV